MTYTDADLQTERLLRYIEVNDLRPWMAENELPIVDRDRSEVRAELLDTIGWRLENMWPLAWVLGFHRAPELRGAIAPEISRAIMVEFLPGCEGTVKEVLDRSSPRTLQEVIEVEDLFYCAHNAARSAWLGSDTAPPDFDPVPEGGVIHERRHSLTWCLSPSIAWDDTDLST